MIRMLDHTADVSNTPASKSVIIRLEQRGDPRSKHAAGMS
jgi:hypothetical protein